MYVFVHFFQTVEVVIPLVQNTIVLSAHGAIESMLEPHMRKSVGASQDYVGLAFCWMGGSYMVANLVAGFVCCDFPS